MKTAKSAGGIIVSGLGDHWYVVLLKDMSNSWTFPKGLIEKGETPKDAAVREIYEEVGIKNLKFFASLDPIEYIYTHNGSVKKTVYYFVFKLRIRIHPTPQIEEGIQEARWIRIDKAIDAIGYRQTNVALLEETWKLLMRKTSSE